MGRYEAGMAKYRQELAAGAIGSDGDWAEGEAMLYIAKEVVANLDKARTIHIISTPYLGPGAEMARKTALEHTRQSQGVFVFNPNLALCNMAKKKGWDEETQGKKWLEAWTEVAKKVKK